MECITRRYPRPLSLPRNDSAGLCNITLVRQKLFYLIFRDASYIITWLSGIATFGIALGLGAGIPNPVPPRKDRKQPHFSGKFPLYPLLKVRTICGRISLTTYLTTTENLSGCSEAWYRAWFGSWNPKSAASLKRSQTAPFYRLFPRLAPLDNSPKLW